MAERRKVRVPSASTHLSALHYPGENGACLVMAPGIGVTKEAGTDMLAKRFHEAGYTVLAFEYRRLGESGGHPRQIVRANEQLDDWQAALGYARTLPDVEETKIAAWGFSMGGGHIFSVAKRNPWLGGAIAHAAIADGWHASKYVRTGFSPWAFLKFNALAYADLIKTKLGGQPILIPLYGDRGDVASITTEDSKHGPVALNPGGRYDDSWPMNVSAWSALALAFYRPGRDASDIRCPLLVLEFEEDGVTPPGPAAEAARTAPRGELVQLPGGHYAAMLDQHEQAMSAMLDFLSRHLLGQSTGSQEPDPVVA